MSSCRRTCGCACSGRRQNLICPCSCCVTNWEYIWCVNGMQWKCFKWIWGGKYYTMWHYGKMRLHEIIETVFHVLAGDCVRRGCYVIYSGITPIVLYVGYTNMWDRKWNSHNAAHTCTSPNVPSRVMIISAKERARETEREREESGERSVQRSTAAVGRCFMWKLYRDAKPVDVLRMCQGYLATGKHHNAKYHKLSDGK